MAVKSHVEIPRFIHTEFDPRLNTSPFYTAWLKVSEGCNRNCTFCIIPTLRGKLRSRSVDSLIIEAQALAKSGVRELNIISQDLSDYGVDLDDNNNLSKLLSGLEGVEGIDWIRLFYYYPDELTDEIIEQISKSKKICHYLDMPVQHFSNNILRRMNRKITGEKIHERISKIRNKIPELVVRTSIIVGFPGETREDFEILLEGIKRASFDHLGIFRYSDEEGTPAYKIYPKVESAEIDRRFNILYETQLNITRERKKRFLDRVVPVLIEGFHEETNLLIKGRMDKQAPDIDGNIFINDTKNKILKVGEMVQVKITEVLDHDLVGEIN